MVFLSHPPGYDGNSSGRHAHQQGEQHHQNAPAQGEGGNGVRAQFPDPEQVDDTLDVLQGSTYEHGTGKPDQAPEQAAAGKIIVAMLDSVQTGAVLNC